MGNGVAIYENGGEVGSLIALDFYVVTQNTNTDTDLLYKGIDKDDAYKAYNSTDADSEDTIVILEKYTNKYKFVYELDEELEETIEDYDIEYNYDDSNYYELVEDGQDSVYELLESKSIERKKTNSELAEEDLINLEKDFIEYFEKQYKEKIHLTEYAGLGGVSKYYYLLLDKNNILIDFDDANILLELKKSDSDVAIFNENSMQTISQNRIKREFDNINPENAVLCVRISNHQSKYSMYGDVYLSVAFDSGSKKIEKEIQDDDNVSSEIVYGIENHFDNYSVCDFSDVIWSVTRFINDLNYNDIINNRDIEEFSNGGQIKKGSTITHKGKEFEVIGASTGKLKSYLVKDKNGVESVIMDNQLYNDKYSEGGAVESKKNFWKINEDGKSELYFDYNTFKGLSDTDKKEIKSYYLWSRGKSAWVSKAVNNSTRTERIAERTGLSFMGASKKESSFNYRTKTWIKQHFDFVGKDEWETWGEPKNWEEKKVQDFYINEEGVDSLGIYPNSYDDFYNDYWQTARKDIQSVYDDLTLNTENVSESDKKIIIRYLDSILKIVKGESPYTKTLIVDAFMRKLVKMPLVSKVYAIHTAIDLQEKHKITIFNKVHKFWKIAPEQKKENSSEKSIDDILESDFFKENILDIDKENEELQESGWNRNDINNMADFVKSKQTTPFHDIKENDYVIVKNYTGEIDRGLVTFKYGKHYLILDGDNNRKYNYSNIYVLAEQPKNDDSEQVDNEFEKQIISLYQTKSRKSTKSEVLDVLKRASLDSSHISILENWEGEGSVKDGDSKTGILHEFFTPYWLCKAIGEIAKGLGVENPKVLDPAIGTSRLVSNISYKQYVGFEVNPFNFEISKKLHYGSNVNIYNEPFETAFLQAPRYTSLAKKSWIGNDFDLVVSNPPYGEYRGEYKSYMPKLYTRFEFLFVHLSMSLVKSGGYGIFVLPQSFINNGNMYNKMKEQILKNNKFIDAVRLPNGIFASTDIGVDLLILQKI
jgi:hypothetical protein